MRRYYQLLTVAVKILAGLISDISSTATPGTLPQVLLLLSYMAISQADNFVTFPLKAFENLSRLPNLGAEMATLSRSRGRATRFGYLLLCAAMEKNMEGYDVMFESLVKGIYLGSFTSEAAAWLLQQAKQAVKGEKRTKLVEMIKFFDIYHGESMEKAINEFLVESSDSLDNKKSRKCVLGILEASLEDTVRSPLLDANVTLSAGIDHAQASVRIMALEKLDEICSQKNSRLRDEAEVTLKGALLRRLDDDDMGVVLTVLGLSTLSQLVPNAALFDSLVHCVDRCMTAVHDGRSGKRTRGLGRKAAKAALRQLSTEILEGKSDSSVLGAFISVLFANQNSYTVSLESFNSLSDRNGLLSKALGSLRKKYTAGGASKTRPDGKKRARHNEMDTFDVDGYNQDIVAHLAKAVLSDDDTYLYLSSILSTGSCSQFAKAAVLTVFEHSILISASDKKKASIKDLICGHVLQWFYSSQNEPVAKGRETQEGLRSLWDPATKAMSSQYLSDLSSRICGLCSIEPEGIFMALDAVSADYFTKQVAPHPTPADMFVYFVQLPAGIWHQHIKLLLNKVEGPLGMLLRLWTVKGCQLELTPDIAAVTAALTHWSRFVSENALTEHDKQMVVRSIMSLICIMSHPSMDVRKAALESSERLMASIKKWWPKKTGNKSTTMDTIFSLLEMTANNEARILGDTDGIEYLLQQVAEGTSLQARQRNKGKTQKASDLRLNFSDGKSLCSFLHEELSNTTDSGDGINGLAAVPILVRTLMFSSESKRLSLLSSELLDRLFFDIETDNFNPSLDLIEKRAAFELVSVLNDASLRQSSGQVQEKVLRSSLSASQWIGHSDLRFVALKSLYHCTMGTVAIRDMQAICKVLMTAASTESSSDCREAAIDTLERIDIKPEVLVPFLRIPGIHENTTKPKSSQPRKKRSVKGAVGSQDMTEAPSLSLCHHTLELLQWKKDIQGLEIFVEPLQLLVREYMTLSEDNSGLAAARDDSAENEVQGPAAAGYGLQLCLSALLYISEEASLESRTRSLFDTETIVACASGSSDHAVRTAALELLRSRIESNSEGAMDQILRTIQTICDVASSDVDKYSTVLAARTMSTASAAWMRHGNSIHDLVSKVIDAIQDSSTSRKYTILGAMVDAMPSNAAEIMASITYHLLVSNTDSEEDCWKGEAAFSMVSKVRNFVDKAMKTLV
jgi:hypothetical protein